MKIKTQIQKFEFRTVENQFLDRECLHESLCKVFLGWRKQTYFKKKEPISLSLQFMAPSKTLPKSPKNLKKFAK